MPSFGLPSCGLSEIEFWKRWKRGSLVRRPAPPIIEPPPILPMLPRGPTDMPLGRNCACDADVAAATTTTAKAVEIDKTPISLKRLLEERMAVPPRKDFNSRSAPYFC